MAALPLRETAREIRRRLVADERDLTVGGDGDLEYWSRVAAQSDGSIVEIGCGAGRILLSLNAAKRSLIGIDLDREALSLAAERDARPVWECADGRCWRDTSVSASLVILGGDLISVITREADLRELFLTAAVHCATDGQVGIDATRIDPQRLAEHLNGTWALDLEREDEEFGVVQRYSRLSADARLGSNVAALEIRHLAVAPGRTPTPLYPDRAPFPIRAWRSEEIRSIAEAVGLELVRVEADDRLRWLLRSTHD